MLASFGKMPTTSARRLTSLFSRSNGLVECSLVRVLSREGDVGENLVLAVVHQHGELGPTRPELVGDVAPGVMRGRGIGLQKGLTDRGSNHRVLALRDMRQGVAHPMYPA